MINLSDGEFRLLLVLVKHPRRMLTRDTLLDLSRGANAEHCDVQMSRLRKKLARHGNDEMIRTGRNEGYLSPRKSPADESGGVSARSMVAVLAFENPAAKRHRHSVRPSPARYRMTKILKRAALFAIAARGDRRAAADFVEAGAR